MPVKAASSYNLEQDSFQAGATAARECMAALDGRAPDVVFLFLTVGHDIGEVIRGIHSVAGEVALCGSSGAGTITNHGCDEASHSVGLLAMRLENVECRPFLFRDLSTEATAIGESIAAHVHASGVGPEDKQLLVLFPDGKSVYADALYRGLDGQLGYHIDVVGGTSGNDFQIEETYQFAGTEVAHDAVAGALFTGDFNYNIRVSHGSQPVGLFRTVTRAEGPVIYEIDGVPALEVLESFIGKERAKDFGHTLNLFELGIAFTGQGYSQDVIMRAILGVDEETKGIKLAVDIPEGSQVRVTRRDEDLVIQRTQEQAEALLGEMQRPEQGAYFFFECSGRGTYLFGEPEPDVDALLEVTGREVPMLGFYTFGELAPVQGTNHFHNYTAILVGLE